MKRLCFKKNQTKRGVASFYIVIFATILFGVVTLSFMRIILSEAGQSSNDDLSRSAYDSAIAGVEDAKTAVNRYYACLNGNANAANKCSEEDYSLLFGDGSRNCDNGIGIAKYLYGNGYNTVVEGKVNPNEVLIQETNAGTSGSNNNSDQAYTCVILSDTVPDYRGTLTSDTPTKVIPLGISDGTNSTTSIQDTRMIRFSWYSRLNEGSIDFSETTAADNDYNLRNIDNPIIPPVVSITLLRAKQGMAMSDFYKANNDADYATMILTPVSVKSDGAPILNISYNEIKAAGNVDAGKNSVFRITCSKAREFACVADLDVSGMTLSNTDSLFLIVSLPYRDTISDFSAALYRDVDGNSPIDLTGVQVQVDSTGRTNQLLRRVETRLDPADLFFPYPQYELELDGGNDQSFDKDFWITANCWHSHPSNGGLAQTCDNNAKIQN